ncbi:MAG TPA: (2Fe-2S)-binding protein [Acidimicrobiia bacterium]|nr:(2Fe-2S)-binding protein [Acidimicrobiia bacterium]
MNVTITINGEQRVADVAGFESLLNVLRDDLDLPGTKDACEQGECGSCTVILDGEAVCSCLVMAADAEGSDVTTVEGLSSEGDLHPVQEAMLAAGAVQCGFCTPGIVVAGSHLLETNPHPSELEIREALSGNICRCTGYGAILRAFETLSEEGT